MTGAEYLHRRFQRLIDELEMLGGEVEFDAEDPWRFVRDAAAILERWLQRCTLRRPLRDGRLVTLIDALKGEGVPVAAREALHGIRKAANAGKHDASRRMSSLEAERLLEGAQSAIEAIAIAGVPELLAAYSPEYKRRYIIAVYDHFTGGEVEFNIWLAAYPPDPEPPPGYDPPQVELFQIRHDDEEAVKESLEATGRIIYEGGVPEDVQKALRADAEFTFAWVWEGSHHDLVTAFAPYQHEMNVIAGLLRGDHAQSVISSVAAAATEMPRPFDWRDLLLKLESEYGVSRRGTEARSLAEGVSRLIKEIPETVQLSGPRWLDGSGYQEAAMTALALDDRLGLAVLQDGTVLVRWDVRGRGIAIEAMSADDLQRPEDPLLG